MHCDWLNITVPESCSDDVHREVSAVLHAVGAIAGIELAGKQIHRLTSGGTLQHSRKNGFDMYGASGDLLASLRSSGYFNEYLSCFAWRPHKVTKLDIAHDVFTPSPPVLKRLYGRCKAGKMALTRKSLTFKQFNFVMRPHSDGGDTGTLYLGRRTSEVYAKVYDKQAERLDKGFDCDGPCTRYELSVTSKVGVSLADVISPDAMFWRFMSTVLTPPASVPDWVASTHEDYNLGPRADLLPAELLSRKVETSAEIGSLLALADTIGPEGFSYFLSRLKARHRQKAPASAVVE